MPQIILAGIFWIVFASLCSGLLVNWTNLLGQPNFYATTPTLFSNPNYITKDPINNSYYLSDSNNNRVLRFNSTQWSSFNGSPELIIGSSSGCSPTSFNRPAGLAITSDRLYVVDQLNKRVVFYDNPRNIMTNFPSANGVIGQVDFLTCSATTFDLPFGVDVDMYGSIWVGMKNFVLRFPDPFSTPDLYLNQDHSSAFCSIAFDSQGNLYVSNVYYISVYDLAVNMTTDLGKTRSFSPYTEVVTDSKLGGIMVEKSKDVMAIADLFYNKVYIVQNVSQANMANMTAIMYGQPSDSTSLPGTSQDTLNLPYFMYYEPNPLAPSHYKVYIADSDNYRVVMFDSLSRSLLASESESASASASAFAFAFVSASASPSQSSSGSQLPSHSLSKNVSPSSLVSPSASVSPNPSIFPSYNLSWSPPSYASGGSSPSKTIQLPVGSWSAPAPQPITELRTTIGKFSRSVSGAMSRTHIQSSRSVFESPMRTVTTLRFETSASFRQVSSTIGPTSRSVGTKSKIISSLSVMSTSRKLNKSQMHSGLRSGSVETESNNVPPLGGVSSSPKIDPTEKNNQSVPSVKHQNRPTDQQNQYKAIGWSTDFFQVLEDSEGQARAYIKSSSEELLYELGTLDDPAIISSVLELVTVNGQALSRTITLCFVVADDFVPQETTQDKLDCKIVKRNGCLAYHSSETKEWECQDRSLEEKELNGKKTVCGDTPHLTSFAVLLSSSTVSTGLCQSHSRTLVWLSLALLILAIVLSVVVTILFLTNQTCARLIYGKLSYEDVEFKKHLHTLKNSG
eukprot:TRINITY_DN2108_c0_g1_i3.p1 TRINITY_DN2108_c0_g1~~TRINITY_DN2108_c0_g1_i3.p1  ORF type:complete len:793 (-),score=84.64 TRINITY_DN2108_c0_g1_i3:43-2421(-)